MGTRGKKGSKREPSSRKQRDSARENGRKQKKGKTDGYLAFFWKTCRVPIAVLALAFAVHKWGTSTVDPQVSEMVRRACSMDDVYCSPAVVPTRRTFKAIRRIQAGETILKIPRRLQVWDLDAVRDPFIKENLLSARISSARSPLDSKAFLTVYVARLLKHRPDDLDPILSSWLDTLATNYVYENHPVFWSKQELEEDLGSYTLAYDFVMNVRQKARDAYEAFAAVSDEFAKDISFDEYLAVSVTVGSRTFGSNTVFRGQPRAEPSEIAFFLEKTGIDLSQGSCLFPVIDVFDHHRKGYVVVNGGSDQVAVVRAKENGAPAGSEILFDYGGNPENYLFALYGFTTGDGSHPTYASLELWHKANRNNRNVDEVNMLRSQHKTQILKYLQYDDGYVDCVNSTQDKSWAFKIAKYKFLAEIALQEGKWGVYGNPRNPDAQPAMASNLPSTREVPTFRSLDGSLFMEDRFYVTCRLLSLTEHDYEGKALKRLKDHLKNNATYIIPPTGEQDAFAYRTLHCVKRMATTALDRYGMSVQDQVNLVARLNREAFQSRAWIVAHVRLGEMQTLELLKDTAVKKLQAFGSVPDSDPLYFIREKPCSLDLVEPLTEHFLS